MSTWTNVQDGLPEVDDDNIAYVWAVDIGAPGFPRAPMAGKVRFHKSLGWQPEGSTGWDWIITHWMHFPDLPA
jgi:hypothetical protein